MSELRKHWEEYNEVDMKIMRKLASEKTEEPHPYKSEDRYGKTESKYTDYMSELAEGLRKVTNPLETADTNDPTPTLHTTVVHHESLPRISLPKFNGDFDMWRSFHDLFVSLVHYNTSLKPVQKLHHLKTSLVGDAERILRHFPITNEDYEPAWAKLKEGYENTRILVNHQLKRLVSQSKLNVESTKNLKEFIETTEECMQQLKNLKVDTTSWDVLLIHILVQRLPFITLRHWEEELGTQKELPKLQQFMSFLNTRLKVLESIADTITPRNVSARPTTTKEKVASYHIVRRDRCPACEGKHYVQKCPVYKQMNPQTKINTIKSSGRCINCLSSKHSHTDCTSKFNCFKCKQKHHTSLHDDTRNKQPANNSRKVPSPASEVQACPRIANDEGTSHSADNTVQAFITNQNVRALLSTALVSTRDKRGERHILRCLVDPGSQSSFITQAACQRLGAICSPAAITITSINTTTAANAKCQTTLQLQGCTPEAHQIEETFLVIPEISDPLPRHKMQKRNLGHIVGLPLADSTFWKSGRIDALLGAIPYAEILQEGIVKTGKRSPVAVNTLFGWLLVGPTTSLLQEKTIAMTVTTESLSNQISKFWEIEEIPSSPMLTKEEEQCEGCFQASHKRLSNGQYEVKLPFVNNQSPILGESRPQALKRFNALMAKFQRFPDLAKDYTKCLNEYLELNQMQMVESSNSETSHYYIPHHAVFKDSTTTKLRVVFDASCKTTNGKSLNDFLLKGPTIQHKLFSLLLNWRKHKIAITGDIEKMYRMIWMHPDHQNFQRIIWKHPTEPRLQEYQLKTVTFGTTSAPYLAIRTLHQLAEDEKDRWPLASKATFKNFYVDDLLAGANDVTDAKKLQKELIEMLKSGGFKLRKWASNSPDLLSHLPKEYLQSKDSLLFGDEDHIKTLGIRWHPATDNFTFQLTAKLQNKASTKRTILSEIASLYDPLGWLSPVIIVAKILIQELWITGCSWDDQVSDPIAQKWEGFKGDLNNLIQLRIPRWIGYIPSANIQVHGFCDASNKAYAAVLYLRVEYNNKISCTLLTSKTKVAPVKPTTIPRLELNGALILARLIKTISNDMEFKNVPIYAWTDSTIVLQWIKEHPSRWKTYVANRVLEIQEIIKYDNWHHISTNQNPADIASRGTTVLNLQSNEMWWKGPEWLSHPEITWPICQKISDRTDLEAKKPASQTFNITVKDDILLKYSSFTRLSRILANMLRFIQNCRRSSVRQLNISYVKQAENVIFRLVQQSSFKDEYNNLSNKTLIHNKSKLLQLNPFMDDQGIIRVGSRLQRANITFNKKHPIILPKDHHITRLIINKIHLETMHGGLALVLATSRNNYWILDARRTITSQIHKCVTCARHRKQTITQLMGNLPDERVNISKPFSRVGIDYAGPIIIKTSHCRKAKQLKAYFCIFICMVTKAVHIEAVSSLASEAFLAALKRFVSRRGLCTDIFSDCGTNFIGGKRLLDKDLQEAISKSTPIAAQYLASKSIQWHFNPPAAPHFGGLWEAGVKSIKNHLRRSLGNAICTFEEFSTILAQIECCLNSRPLSYISNDPSDVFILTPGHFLIGDALNAVPEPDCTNDKIPPLQRWRHLQQRVRHFWKRWSRDYLHQLQNRPKWFKPQRNIQIGDIVLLKSENSPPTCWPLGKIEQVYPGQDGLIRVVQMEYYGEDGVITLLEDIYFSPVSSPIREDEMTHEVVPEAPLSSAPEVPPPSSSRSTNKGRRSKIGPLEDTTHTKPRLTQPAIINGSTLTDLERLRPTTSIKEFELRIENSFQAFITREGIRIYMPKEVVKGGIILFLLKWSE